MTASTTPSTLASAGPEWLYLAFGLVLVLVLLETFPRVGGAILAVIVIGIVILNARGLTQGPRVV